VLIGQATGLSSLMMDQPRVPPDGAFGATSSTADPTGDVRPTGKVTDRRALVAALDAFRGRITRASLSLGS